MMKRMIRSGLVGVFIVSGAVACLACTGTLDTPNDEGETDQSLVARDGYRPPTKPGPAVDAGRDAAPGACFRESQGGPTSCKPPELWTKYGAEACRGKSANITQVSFTDACGGGNYRAAAYECCGETKPEPPGPAVCKMYHVGAGMGCRMNESWRFDAEQTCAKDGLMLTAFDTGAACGTDATGGVTYQCCDRPGIPVVQPGDGGVMPSAPPPSTSTCTLESEPSGPCRTPADYFAEATAICAPKGLRPNIMAMNWSGTCPFRTSYTSAKISCCKD